MNVDIKQTNTTEASTTLSHDDLVKVLGLAVKVQAGIPSDTPGTTVDVKIVPVDGTDQFTATVDVLVDHNYVEPDPKKAEDEDDLTTKEDTSSKADTPAPAGTPVIPTTLVATA